MARISTYVSDNDINPDDKWIGSDTNNGFVTKNFTAKGLAYYLNRFNEVGVGSQVNYKFIVDQTNGVQVGEMAIGDGGQNNLPISNITEVKFSKYASDGKSIIDYFDYLVGEDVIVFNTSDRNNFGHFKFVSLLESTPDVYIGTFELVAANGVLVDSNVYGIGLFQKSYKDKNYRHIQGSSSAVWSINHNLDKYPSVTVKDSAGSTVIGEVQYIDEDNLTITFSGAFSGEAYLN
jgi:hypothetical protein